MLQARLELALGYTPNWILSPTRLPIYNNVKSGLLGRASCSNSENIETSLNAITSDVELRVIEIEKYINKFSV